MTNSEVTPRAPNDLGHRYLFDALVIYFGRGLRDMGRGLIAVILAIYLAHIGLSVPQIGLVLGSSLVGGFTLSLVVMFTANMIKKSIQKLKK